jgi:ABC-type thiamine transport system ATPase subunit
MAAGRLGGVERQRAQLARDIANVRSLLGASETFEALVKGTIRKMLGDK